MIGLSWNVRGLGNPHTFAALKRLLKKHSLVLVFLCETKMGGSRVGNFRSQLGFGNGFSIDSNMKSGGILLLWNDNLNVSILSYSTCHIDARIQMEDGFRWRFSGFYGDLIPSKRMNSLILLRCLRDMDNLPWVCGDDFNKLLSMSEKIRGSKKAILGMLQFR